MKNKYVYNFLMILMFFISDDSLLFGTNINEMFIAIKFPLYMALLCILIGVMAKDKMKISKQSINIFFIFLFLILLTIVFNLDFRFGYLYRVLSLFLGLLIANFMGISGFISTYNKVLTFISTFSIVVFLLEVTQLNLLSFFPTVVNTTGKAFHNLIFTVVPLDNYGVPRNYGPFREPGVFVLFLIIGLIFELFTDKNSSLQKQLIFVVGIITTRSTTGYIVLIFIYLVFLFVSKSQKFTTKNKLLFLLFSSILVYFVVNHTEIIFSENQYKSVFSKFENIDDTVARFSSVIVNLMIFLSSPFFGVGFTKLDQMFSSMTLAQFGVFSEHNTNTLLIQISTYGLFFGVLWIICLISFIIKIVSSKRLIIPVFIAFVLIFVGENISNNLVLSTIIMFGSTNTFNINDNSYDSSKFDLRGDID